MDILITGSTGFLGKEVKLALKKYNHKLLFIGNKKIPKKQK
jgi:nucleoside-diphosphate-sugar epimerase